MAVVNPASQFRDGHELWTCPVARADDARSVFREDGVRRVALGLGWTHAEWRGEDLEAERLYDYGILVSPYDPGTDTRTAARIGLRCVRASLGRCCQPTGHVPHACACTPDRVSLKARACSCAQRACA